MTERMKKLFKSSLKDADYQAKIKEVDMRIDGRSMGVWEQRFASHNQKIALVAAYYGYLLGSGKYDPAIYE